MLSQLLMTIKGMLLITAAIYGFAALLRNEEARWVKDAPLKIMLSMFFIGMWGHNYWVAYAALVLTLPILAKGRADAAALFCLLTVALPLMAAKIFIGSFFLASVNKYTFCAIGLLISFAMNKDKSQVLRRSRFDVPMLIMIVLEIAQARDPSFTATLRQCTPVLFALAIPYFVLSRSLNKPEDVRRFLLAFALAGFVMAAVATVEARLHWLIYKGIEGRLGIHTMLNGYSKMRAGMVRAPASFPESTSLGTFLALAGMAAMAVRGSFKTQGKWYVVLGVLVLGLISANSRGAIVALGVGLVAWDLYCRRFGQLSIKLAGAGAIYLFALTAAQFSTYFAAMVGKGSGTDATAQYRIQLLRRGLEEIHKHPLLGQNIKAALDNLEDMRQGEGIIDLVNGYISFGLTLGYTGIIGLLAVFLSLCATMWMARKKLRANPALLEPAACVFAVATLSIPNSFFTAFGDAGSTSFYEMTALGAALWAMRGLAPASSQGAGQATHIRMPAGLAGLIAADRARAAQSARRPGPKDCSPVAAEA